MYIHLLAMRFECIHFGVFFNKNIELQGNSISRVFCFLISTKVDWNECIYLWEWSRVKKD